MSTSRRCRLPGQTFQPTQSIWGSALEIVLGCCQMLHNTSCNRCNRSRGLFVRVDEENERCSISWSSHTSSQAHSSVWGASELLCLTAVFGTFNAKSCNQNDAVVKLYKSDVLLGYTSSNLITRGAKGSVCTSRRHIFPSRVGRLWIVTAFSALCEWWNDCTREANDTHT